MKNSDKEPVYNPCYFDHPALPLGKDKLLIYGSSCSDPNVEDADIYVALQHGASSSRATDPWDTKNKKVVEVQFAIPDMGVPKDVKRFKAMIVWLCNQLQSGKKIHVGCIGGHGRTGMVLAAMAAHLGNKKGIQYVRKHYCQKAVETREQIDFLRKHFGVEDAPVTKKPVKFAQTSGGYPLFEGGGYYESPDHPRSIYPINNAPLSLWGHTSKLGV